MKYSFAALAVLCLAGSAFASPDCTNSKAIEKAAIKQANEANRLHDASVSQISFTRTTKNGKQDEYTVQMTVNEECMSVVYVYTDVNTCDVNSAAGGAIGEGDCG